MKKEFKYISKLLLLTAAISVTGCTKLEDRNYNQIVIDQYEFTDQDVAALIGSAYVNWRQTFLLWDGVWRAQELSADELVIPARPNGWVDGGMYKRLHQHTWTPDEGVVVQGWQRTFAGVSSCNRVIYQIEQGTVNVPADQVEALLAELRVLRASYYYILCDLYGNVPLVTEFDVPEGFLPEQSSRSEVYQFIVDEITNNINLLSEETGASTYGRFNKWAAYTLLAKVYLNAEVYSGTPQWQACIDACDQVISSGAYSLETLQKTVFSVENHTSSEIIFGLPVDQVYSNTTDADWNAFDIHMQSLQPSQQQTFNLLFAPWGGMGAIPQFIETFHPEDRRLTENWFYGQQYDANGDTLLATLGAFTGEPLFFVNEIPSIDESEAIHSYRLRKFEIEAGATNILNNDFPLLRYADVLMMKAEALLRTGNPGDAASLVTEVRQRAFEDPSLAEVTAGELEEGSSYDYSLQGSGNGNGGESIMYGRFLDELAWEFNQEGRRRQDMIRFGVFTDKEWFFHSPAPDTRNLFPIPRTVVNNNPNIQQNPGY